MHNISRLCCIKHKPNADCTKRMLYWLLEKKRNTAQLQISKLNYFICITEHYLLRIAHFITDNFFNFLRNGPLLSFCSAKVTHVLFDALSLKMCNGGKSKSLKESFKVQKVVHFQTN